MWVQHEQNNNEKLQNPEKIHWKYSYRNSVKSLKTSISSCIDALYYPFIFHFILVNKIIRKQLWNYSFIAVELEISHEFRLHR